MERILAVLFAALLSFFPQKTEDTPVLRAMLIGSDTFVTQENTYPIAQNNLTGMQNLLQSDRRTYHQIGLYYEKFAAPNQLQADLQAFFADCDDNDISLIYFSTHGVMTEETAGLYLSDGTTESLLTPQALSTMLSDIPGTKILILDTCNSGVFIQKGLFSTDTNHPFIGRDIYVLTSAGACEASWQWQGTQHSVSGGSYFTTLLVNGLLGHHAADINKDNTVTVNEAFSYICENMAASTPQRYPQFTGDLPLYTYSDDPSAIPPAISGLTFDDTLLSPEQSDILFSFTVNRQTKLYYQLVYYTKGKWDFENASFFHDTQESDVFLTPGRKQRKLTLDAQSHEDSGYVMIQLFSVEEETPIFVGGRLLCIQPGSGQVQLQVTTANAFDPFTGKELGILVTHDVPCTLSVTVRDVSGKTIRRLSYASPTRPLQLESGATPFYWDGRDNRGRMAAPGKYYIHVQTNIGDTRFTAESDFFILETITEDKTNDND